MATRALDAVAALELATHGDAASIVARSQVILDHLSVLSHELLSMSHRHEEVGFIYAFFSRYYGKVAKQLNEAVRAVRVLLNVLFEQSNAEGQIPRAGPSPAMYSLISAAASVLGCAHALQAYSISDTGLSALDGLLDIARRSTLDPQLVAPLAWAISFCAQSEGAPLPRTISLVSLILGVWGEPKATSKWDIVHFGTLVWLGQRLLQDVPELISSTDVLRVLSEVSARMGHSHDDLVFAAMLGGFLIGTQQDERQAECVANQIKTLRSLEVQSTPHVQPFYEIRQNVQPEAAERISRSAFQLLLWCIASSVEPAFLRGVSTDDLLFMVRCCFDPKMSTETPDEWSSVRQVYVAYHHELAVACIRFIQLRDIEFIHVLEEAASIHCEHILNNPDEAESQKQAQALYIFLWTVATANGTCSLRSIEICCRLFPASRLNEPRRLIMLPSPKTDVESRKLSQDFLIPLTRSIGAFYGKYALEANSKSTKTLDLEALFFSSLLQDLIPNLGVHHFEPVMESVLQGLSRMVRQDSGPCRDSAVDTIVRLLDAEPNVVVLSPQNVTTLLSTFLVAAPSLAPVQVVRFYDCLVRGAGRVTVGALESCFGEVSQAILSSLDTRDPLFRILCLALARSLSIVDLPFLELSKSALDALLDGFRENQADFCVALLLGMIKASAQTADPYRRLGCVEWYLSILKKHEMAFAKL
ncbi:hypothetical protein FVE85_0259 [Porphyridium purpureum]|uniref:Uncharacterized protein n=1 Tax=Porphyridium purpureum TaxID=35688 RepID=A0A5J4YZU0_PORPP|nr:hypothetical protein FVE85_0259 [Porphyridium purpureum]|eukprot:POR4480..scf208_2